MKFLDKLPKVELMIDPEDDKTGIEFISIVEDPAIEVKGLAFANDVEPIEYKFEAIADKQIIAGPAMIPNKLMYRSPCIEFPQGYQAYYTEETVRQCMNKFNRLNKNKAINFEHSETMVDGYVIESWMVESTEFDKSKMYGFDLPVGTWFVCVKIEDAKFWQEQVKDGKCSFSIEGWMGHIPTEMDINAIIDSLTEEELKDILEN